MAAGAYERVAPAEAPSARARRALRVVTRVPRAALVCALVAFLNAAAWSVLTPAFQVPDEQAHYAYAEYVSQHGRPPEPSKVDLFSEAQAAAMEGVKFETTHFIRRNATIWSASEQQLLQQQMRLRRDRSGGNGASRTVGGEPPLFYALETIPYRVAAGGTALDRLALMRLLAAALGGATVLFVFLFLRELLPAHPRSWLVGALGVAFLPLFAFITSGVNSDALLFASSAAMFYLLARAFRRGLDARSAIAMGLMLATGVLTKYNGWALVPGATLGLLAISLRQEGALRVRALGLPALALAVAVAPALLEMLLNTAAWNRPAVGASGSAFALTGDIDPTIGGALAYAWEYYVAPLPGMARPLGSFPLWDGWYKGLVGRFGWIETVWRGPFYGIALVPIAAVAMLAAATLARGRRALRARWPELTVYALLALSFLLFVSSASYVFYLRNGVNNVQARYLLPLLPLYGGVLALATRGAGRRWAPVVGAAIVVLAIAHDVFAQLLVVARYYT